MIFNNSLKFILKFFIFLIFLILIYFLTAYLLTFFVDKKVQKKENREKVYILYSSMHSDIVMNINKIKSKKLQTKLKFFNDHKYGYLAFGWGDKETYLNTPTWSDIKVSTTFKALFINTPSIMHISFYKRIDRFKSIKEIALSKEQKIELEKSILKSFDLEKNISYRGYAKNDIFYPSIYKYNLFNTCNTWTGDRLRDANISISYWTPLSSNVIDSLP